MINWAISFVIEQGTRVEGTNSGTNYSANLKYEYDALSQLTRKTINI